MLEIVIIAGILALDQISKFLSDRFLSPLGTSIPVIQDVFHLTSAHNTGAAWGMLPGRKWMFLILTLFVCLFVLLLLLRARRRMTVFARVTLSMLLAGAVGNAVDRLLFSYVRDFFDFRLINFPIFNVADCALTVGCICLIIDMLFLKERSVFELRLRLNEPPPDTEAERTREREAERDGE
ncbi:MAG: signal peptidase II [Clostridia bacterium]|nr:signal peptidase II [Clostridia bacterium]